MDADDQAILARLDQLGALLFARDPAIVDELWSDLGFRLVGSEPAEIADTREGLAALMTSCSPARRACPGHGPTGW